MLPMVVGVPEVPSVVVVFIVFMLHPGITTMDKHNKKKKYD